MSVADARPGIVRRYYKACFDPPFLGPKIGGLSEDPLEVAYKINVALEVLGQKFTLTYQLTQHHNVG